jgi:hypothetical protein
MNSRAVIARLARELIPAPTLGRLVYIKRGITGPRQLLIADLSKLSQRVLSPTMHLRVRRIASNFFKRKSGSQTLSHVSEQSESHVSEQSENLLKGPFYFRGQIYESLSALKEAHGSLKADMVITSAFLGRHEVLDMMVTEATATPEGYEVLVCLAGSSSEDEAYLKDVTARNPDVLGMLGPNSPVGRKWQSVVDLARASSDFQLLGITGSDDILPVGLITSIIERHRVCCSHDSIIPFATSIYGTMQWLIFSNSDKDTLSPQIIKCSYKLGSAIMPLGAGRFYSRKVMDDFEGDIFEVSKNRLLDDKGFYKVHNSGLGVEYYGVTQGAVLSLKGDWSQMNSFDAILQAPTVKASEFSFEGYDLLRKQLTAPTFERLFGKAETDLAHHS